VTLSCRRRSSEDCADNSSSSSSSSSSEADALNPAEQCLLEGLTDQLDATEAELEHLAQQLQQQQAAIAAADAAAAALRSRVDGMSSRQLAVVLQQALNLLVEQGTHWQAVLHKVGAEESILLFCAVDFVDAACTVCGRAGHGKVFLILSRNMLIWL
jgi:hypothetical protein